MVDGVDNNDKSVTGPQSYISPEEVAEFTLLQNQFSSEFARSNGGNFLTVTKSGTNEFHGTAYGFFRNCYLNALDTIQKNAGFTRNKSDGDLLQDALDYSSIAEIVSKIRGKANELKEGLSLPESENSQTALKPPAVTTVRQFREELLLLDKTMMSFVNNPVFQAANTVDVNLAKKASEDLDQVILLTFDLKQNAQKLRKTTQ